MAELKQIEVNGTTYDIGIPGSELPVVCEVYDVEWSGETIVDKMNGGGSLYHYQEISSNILLKTKTVSDGSNNTYSVVIAIPDTALSNDS